MFQIQGIRNIFLWNMQMGPVIDIMTVNVMFQHYLCIVKCP